MTKEDKQLLLVDLCARLPYSPFVKLMEKYDDDDSEYFREIHNLSTYDIELFNSGEISNIKPYLRPMSSMTEEEMDRLFDILQIDKDGKDEDWIKINDVYGIKFFFPTGKWIENVVEAYDYLYSIHIDFRGLIHKGLALEVTEENNPYKD